jgi:hypothetical protein
MNKTMKKEITARFTAFIFFSFYSTAIAAPAIEKGTFGFVAKLTPGAQRPPVDKTPAALSYAIESAVLLTGTGTDNIVELQLSPKVGTPGAKRSVQINCKEKLELAKDLVKNFSSGEIRYASVFYFYDQPAGKADLVAAMDKQYDATKVWLLFRSKKAAYKDSNLLPFGGYLSDSTVQKLLQQD